MIARSLRARLGLAAAISIALALVVAAIALVTLFERHVERRIGAELVVQLNQLAAAIGIDAAGDIAVDPLPADPRFSQPLGGLYWQIDDESDAERRIGVIRSRSLWDTPLRLPPDRLKSGVVHAHRLPGPGGQQLLVRERIIRIDDGTGARSLRLMAAVDRTELSRARDAFAADMLPYLAVIALALGIATVIQIHAGLAPLEALRRGIGAIRSGRGQRLADDYPDEVMPLVAEVNGLLAAREQAVERARAWTADLAHGLKTPLSALSADAQRLRQAGSPSLADNLEQLAQTMRRRVDRELVRARVRSGTETRQARADLGPAIRRVLNTLRRTPRGAVVDWQITDPAHAMPQAVAALMPDDLLELLGNLLENAAKWARGRVTVSVHSDGQIHVRIADDGPGVPAEQLKRLGERGLRLDRQKEGSGLGLAIVRDIIDAYGGTLAFDAADEGGLEVQVTLPAAAS
ncbi:MAG: HAMP domain-containing sensor histidine kinase [Thiohalocapsa sp.]